jgi:CubicO group peptidase (beta-lactamase class C family)
MHRRDFLLGAITAPLAACSRTPAETPPPAAYPPVQAAIDQAIKPDALPGAVWLIARGDDVVAQASGVRAIGSRDPMQRDTIFRIASMTKAVTSAAVMVLVEDGRLTLEENAERLLPELADRRVLRTLQSELDDTVPARAPITVRQLMDFTFGFGLSFDPTLPIVQAGQQQQLALAEPVPFTPHDPDEWMRRFGTLPLMYQPGERWLYNVGSLIQGVLVCRASGMDFDTFVHERIIDPLGMRDTGFFVPDAKLDRFAGCGTFTDPETQHTTRQDHDGAQSVYASRPPVFPSGAAGLCSTADDYLAFARMLRAGGEHDGRRLFSADSVRAMTTDQLTDAQRTASAESLFPGFFDTNSWGYGVGVQVAPEKVVPTPGTYGWMGGFGSDWFTDPNRDLIAIALTQSADFLFNGGREAFRAAVAESV